MFKLRNLTEELSQKLYRDIEQFRMSFGLTVDNKKYCDNSDDLHYNLALEELTELADADTDIERVDAIIDLIYVLFGKKVEICSETPEIDYLVDLLIGLSDRYNFDFLAAWDEVHSSNMSKLCLDLTEFKRTEEFYANQNVKVYSEWVGSYIAVKCAEDTIFKGSQIKRGKVLKSINYKKAELGKCLF